MDPNANNNTNINPLVTGDNVAPIIPDSTVVQNDNTSQSAVMSAGETFNINTTDNINTKPDPLVVDPFSSLNNMNNDGGYIDQTSAGLYQSNYTTNTINDTSVSSESINSNTDDSYTRQQEASLDISTDAINNNTPSIANPFDASIINPPSQGADNLPVDSTNGAAPDIIAPIISQPDLNNTTLTTDASNPMPPLPETYVPAEQISQTEVVQTSVLSNPTDNINANPGLNTGLNGLDFSGVVDNQGLNAGIPMDSGTLPSDPTAALAQNLNTNASPEVVVTGADVPSTGKSRNILYAIIAGGVLLFIIIVSLLITLFSKSNKSPTPTPTPTVTPTPTPTPTVTPPKKVVYNRTNVPETYQVVDNDCFNLLAFKPNTLSDTDNCNMDYKFGKLSISNVSITGLDKDIASLSEAIDSFKENSLTNQSIVSETDETIDKVSAKKIVYQGQQKNSQRIAYVVLLDGTIISGDTSYAGFIIDASYNDSFSKEKVDYLISTWHWYEPTQ